MLSSIYKTLLKKSQKIFEKKEEKRNECRKHRIRLRFGFAVGKFPFLHIFACSAQKGLWNHRAELLEWR